MKIFSKTRTNPIQVLTNINLRFYTKTDFIKVYSYITNKFKNGEHFYIVDLIDRIGNKQSGIAGGMKPMPFEEYKNLKECVDNFAAVLKPADIEIIEKDKIIRINKVYMGIAYNIIDKERNN